MLSIQYLLVTPKYVFCSNIEISTHLDFKDTQYPSRTPLKYENGRYCSFRQKYFGHWSDALNSDQRKNLITDQKYPWSLSEQTHGYWSRKILGWRQDFLRWEQLWPEAPILKPSRISWKRKDVRDRAIKGDVRDVIISIFESCDSIPILKEDVKDQARGNSIAVKMS